MKQLTIFDFNHRARPINSRTVWCVAPCLNRFSGGQAHCEYVIQELRLGSAHLKNYYCGAPDSECYLGQLSKWQQMSRQLEGYMERRAAQ